MSSFYQLRSEAHSLNLYLSPDGTRCRIHTRPDFDDGEDTGDIVTLPRKAAQQWLAAYRMGYRKGTADEREYAAELAE